MTDSKLLTSDTGLLPQALYLPSTHADERPDGVQIDMIVVHNISLPPGQFGTGAIQAFFTGTLDFDKHPYYRTIAQLRVSAHLLIERTGRVIQFVPFTQRAWHAGESKYEGRTRCNDFSIGIELEGTDDVAYEDKQYAALAEVIQYLQLNYPAITQDRIVGHCDIAPGRKTDPGAAFDWVYLKGKLT